MQLGREWRGKRKVGFPCFSSLQSSPWRSGECGGHQWAHTGSGRCLGPLNGCGQSGVSPGRGHRLTAKFVHSAVEGLGFLRVPVSVVLNIYRSKVSQDSDKAWEVQLQTPGGWGEAGNGAGAVVAVALPLPQSLTSPDKLSPPPPHPRRGSPVREEAVYNAVSQRVHGQRPDRSS